MNEKKTVQGGCLCGAVRYEVRGEPVTLAACHCRECQRQSGSAFGMSLIVHRQDFVLLQGELASFTRKTRSGGSTEGRFCTACGVRILHAPSLMPKTFNVRAGTLDETGDLEPKLHVWTSSKQPWTRIPDGVPQFPENPGAKPDGD